MYVCVIYSGGFVITLLAAPLGPHDALLRKTSPAESVGPVSDPESCVFPEGVDFVDPGSPWGASVPK